MPQMLKSEWNVTYNEQMWKTSTLWFVEQFQSRHMPSITLTREATQGNGGHHGATKLTKTWHIGAANRKIWNSNWTPEKKTKRNYEQFER